MCRPQSLSIVVQPTRVVPSPAVVPLSCRLAVDLCRRRAAVVVPHAVGFCATIKKTENGLRGTHASTWWGYLSHREGILWLALPRDIYTARTSMERGLLVTMCGLFAGRCAGAVVPSFRCCAVVDSRARAVWFQKTELVGRRTGGVARGPFGHPDTAHRWYVYTEKT